MLLNNIDFSNRDVISKLSLNNNIYNSTWEHYCNCYNHAIQKLFDANLLRQYVFNTKMRGVLFILRHSFELCIKRNMDIQNLSIINTHNYETLLNSLKTKIHIPTDFETAIEVINKDLTGECYRYYYDKEGMPYFKHSDIIKLAPLLKLCNNLTQSSFLTDRLFPDLDYNNKIIMWNLTLHIGHSQGLGHVKTEFDQTIEFFIEEILEGKININNVYLPLLAMIRNALEIGLKSNIQLAKEMFPSESTLNYQNEHSLVKLYKYFGDDTGYLSRVDWSKIDKKVSKESRKHLKDFKSLNSTINQLDKNSYKFRFPVDTNGKPNKLKIERNMICKILKLYYSTNAFFTFVNEVLLEEGHE